MWRQRNADMTWNDIWGTHSERVETTFGAYEGFVDWPLSKAESLDDLKQHPWPEPDWWDFGPLPEVLKAMDTNGETHVRFRIGSVFEIGWQLRGMQEFLMDLAGQPELPLYIMDRLTDIYVRRGHPGVADDFQEYVARLCAAAARAAGGVGAQLQQAGDVSLRRVGVAAHPGVH
jgi:hypothetical protein